MKTHFFSFTASALLLIACTSDVVPGPTLPIPVNPVMAPSVTIGDDQVSSISAVLKGKSNIRMESAPMVLGFQYYTITESEIATVSTVIAVNADDALNYSVPLTGLEPNTTYKYWSFVRQNGQDSYGEQKEFTTKPLSDMLETLEASDTGATEVSLNAKADLTDVRYVKKDISYGFLWGLSEDGLNNDINGGEIKDKVFSASLTGLSHKTQYWYKAYIKSMAGYSSVSRKHSRQASFPLKAFRWIKTNIHLV